MRLRRWWWAAIGLVSLAAVGVAIIAVRTSQSLQDLPASLDLDEATGERQRFLDRNGVPLNASYTGEWNLHDRAALHEVPRFLREAFIHAEDKRFFSHDGPDWTARLAAVVTNVRHMNSVRGASTISEQVVRLLHPRPRTVWTRWVEGIEAGRLEQKFSKGQILEFYLNQVPFASRRRGVRQAAEFYFARDLATLSDREMLTLAVLVRSPSRLDLRRDPEASAPAVARLADTMLAHGAIDQARYEAIADARVVLEAGELSIRAPHFLRFATARAGGSSSASVVTTLDAALQARVQHLLDSRMAALKASNVDHGAVLVVDNETGEVIAWVVAGGGSDATPDTHIDPMTTPRQPGSALKPLLYALALEDGATMADVILDAPLAESVGDGIHRYRNYSERFYGQVTLRDALANSLNIPAVKLLHSIGAETFLDGLADFGIESLRAHPDVYGDGLALGNGELTLLELVQAYHVLASRGRMSALRVLRDVNQSAASGTRVVSEATASLIGHALSDPDARAAEFGSNSVLNLPIQTAVKTGTSSDYRDAWSVGFDSRFTVGIWMGNLDQTPTDGVTGSVGPALLLRSVFAWLNRDGNSRPLYLSPQLTRRAVCVPSPMIPAGQCIERDEWFDPAHDAPSGETQVAGVVASYAPIRMRQPMSGLELAFDPRLPPASQAFRFLLDGVEDDDSVEWRIDGELSVATGAGYVWPVSRGEHRVAASVYRDGALLAELPAADFRVR